MRLAEPGQLTIVVVIIVTIVDHIVNNRRQRVLFVFSMAAAVAVAASTRIDTPRATARQPGKGGRRRSSSVSQSHSHSRSASSELDGRENYCRCRQLPAVLVAALLPLFLLLGRNALWRGEMRYRRCQHGSSSGKHAKITALLLATRVMLESACGEMAWGSGGGNVGAVER